MRQYSEEEVQQAIKHIKDVECDELCWASHWVADALLEAREYINEIESEVAKVYCHITNGQLSKANYKADVIIAKYDDEVTELIDRAEESESKVKDLERKLRIATDALSTSTCCSTSGMYCYDEDTNCAKVINPKALKAIEYLEEKP